MTTTKFLAKKGTPKMGVAKQDCNGGLYTSGAHLPSWCHAVSQFINTSTWYPPTYPLTCPPTRLTLLAT